MKKSGVIIVFVILILFISISFVSANLVEDVWNKITGNVVEENVSDGEGDVEPELPEDVEPKEEPCPTIIAWPSLGS